MSKQFVCAKEFSNIDSTEFRSAHLVLHLLRLFDIWFVVEQCAVGTTVNHIVSLHYIHRMHANKWKVSIKLYYDCEVCVLIFICSSSHCSCVCYWENWLNESSVLFLWLVVVIVVLSVSVPLQIFKTFIATIGANVFLHNKTHKFKSNGKIYLVLLKKEWEKSAHIHTPHPA